MESQVVAFHQVLRAAYPASPFRDRELCARAWQMLRRIFPRSAAAVLMPNHLHILVRREPGFTVSEQVVRVHSQMKFFRREMIRLCPRGRWEEVPSPREIPDRQHLARQVRYVHLNPCRRQLCRDPLQWEWSTHRDYLGVIADPWPDTVGLLKLFGYRSGAEGLRAFHQYVSSDPSVHVLGTDPLPVPVAPALLDLAAVVPAAAQCLRVSENAFGHRGMERARVMRVLHSAFGVSRVRVALQFGVGRTAVKVSEGADTSLDAALARALMLTFHDARLRSPVVLSAENDT